MDVLGNQGRTLFSLVDGVEVSTITGSVPREQAFVVVWSKGQLVSRTQADQVLDTLVPSHDPNLLGWQSANSSMKVLFTGSGSDTLRLWDGTLISCNRQGQGQGRCEVEGGAKRRYSYQFR